jgi:hypothetical protein
MYVHRMKLFAYSALVYEIGVPVLMDIYFPFVWQCFPFVHVPIVYIFSRKYCSTAACLCSSTFTVLQKFCYSSFANWKKSLTLFAGNVHLFSVPCQ